MTALSDKLILRDRQDLTTHRESCLGRRCNFKISGDLWRPLRGFSFSTGSEKPRMSR